MTQVRCPAQDGARGTSSTGFGGREEGEGERKLSSPQRPVPFPLLQRETDGSGSEGELGLLERDGRTVTEHRLGGGGWQSKAGVAAPGGQGPVLLPSGCAVTLNMWVLLSQHRRHGPASRREITGLCHPALRFPGSRHILSTRTLLGRAIRVATLTRRDWEMPPLLQAAMCLTENPGSVTKGERIWVSSSHGGGRVVPEQRDLGDPRPSRGQCHCSRQPWGAHAELSHIPVLPHIPSDPSPSLCPCNLGLHSHFSSLACGSSSFCLFSISLTMFTT